MRKITSKTLENPRDHLRLLQSMSRQVDATEEQIVEINASLAKKTSKKKGAEK